MQPRTEDLKVGGGRIMFTRLIVDIQFLRIFVYKQRQMEKTFDFEGIDFDEWDDWIRLKIRGGVALKSLKCECMKSQYKRTSSYVINWFFWWYICSFCVGAQILSVCGIETSAMLKHICQILPPPPSACHRSLMCDDKFVVCVCSGIWLPKPFNPNILRGPELVSKF